MVNKGYEKIAAEKKRFEEFGKPEIALVYHVLRKRGIVLVECRIRRGDEEGISPLIAAAFPSLGKEDLSSLTIHKTFHPAAEFMEKLGDKLFSEDFCCNDSGISSDRQSKGIGVLCFAYTDEKWDSRSLFLIVPLSDSEKIYELLKIPHIEKGAAKADEEEAERIYEKLSRRIGLYNFPLSRLVMPREIKTDILNKSIAIDAMITAPSDIEEIVKDLAFLGFNSVRFNNIRLKSEGSLEKAEEIEAFKKTIDSLAFVEFSSRTPIRMKVYLSIIDDSKDRTTNIDNLLFGEARQ